MSKFILEYTEMCIPSVQGNQLLFNSESELVEYLQSRLSTVMDIQSGLVKVLEFQPDGSYKSTNRFQRRR